MPCVLSQPVYFCRDVNAGFRRENIRVLGFVIGSPGVKQGLDRVGQSTVFEFTRCVQRVSVKGVHYSGQQWLIKSCGDANSFGMNSCCSLCGYLGTTAFIAYQSLLVSVRIQVKMAVEDLE